MFAIAEIDTGGFVNAYLVDQTGERRRCVHKESRLPFLTQPQYERLEWAKGDLCHSKRSHPSLILQYEEGEGVTALWCNAADEKIVTERLRIWSGCYGRWPVRILSEEGK